MRLKDASTGTPGERGKARVRASGNHVKGADDSQRQTAFISREQEDASNDVRSQDAEQCVESDARYLLFVTFAATTLSVILMTRARVDCQSSEDRYNAVCW